MNNKNIASEVFLTAVLLGGLLRIPMGGDRALSLIEIALVGFALYMLVAMLRGSFRLTSIRKREVFLIILIVLLLILELVVNSSKLFSIIMLFEYIFIGLFYYIVFRELGFNHKLFYRLLLLYSLFIGIANFYFNVLNFKVDGYRPIIGEGSTNYTAAMMLLLIPLLFFYIIEAVEEKINIIAYLSIFFMLVGIVLSGSRASLFLLLCEFFMLIIVLRKHLKDKLRLVTCVAVAIFIAFGMVSYVNRELTHITDRYAAYFLKESKAGTNLEGSDGTRDKLEDKVIEQFVHENEDKQVTYLGTGTSMIEGLNMRAHNFVLELILAFGYVGVFICALYFIIFIGSILLEIPLKSSGLIICLTMAGPFFAICYVHPFMTTGREFTGLFWLGLTALGLYSYDFKGRREIFRRKRRSLLFFLK